MLLRRRVICGRMKRLSKQLTSTQTRVTSVCSVCCYLGEHLALLQTLCLSPVLWSVGCSFLIIRVIGSGFA